MNFASTYSMPECGVRVDGKVLNPAQISDLEDADALIDACRQKCSDIVASVVAAREAEVARGFAEGREAGLQSCAVKLLEIEASNATYWNEHKDRITSLVRAILERVAGDTGAQSLVPSLVANALKQMNSERRVIVRVHPDCADSVQAAVQEHARLLPWMERLEVTADQAAQPYDCVIETPNGYVNASWNVQVAAIEAVVTSMAADWVPPLNAAVLPISSVSKNSPSSGAAAKPGE